jgi:biotin transporter BioY
MHNSDRLSEQAWSAQFIYLEIGLLMLPLMVGHQLTVYLVDASGDFFYPFPAAAAVFFFGDLNGCGRVLTQH